MSGPPLGDDELGRLLADGLRRDADRPVDERALMTGAWRGAARIRRRRRTGVLVAAVVVAALPAGVVINRWAQDQRYSASSAASSSASGSEAGPQAFATGAAAGSAGPASVDRQAVQPGAAASPGAAGAGSAPRTRAAPSGVQTPAATPAPSSPATLSRTATGAVVIPAAALLTVADAGPVTSVTLPVADDTANVTSPVFPAAADACGTAPSGLPAEAGGRSVTFQQPAGTSTGWLFGSTVRVFKGTDAAAYLTALTRQECLAPLLVTGLSGALLGQGAPDAQGRVHWLAVGVDERAVTEVRFVAPRGAVVRASGVETVLATAARRLAASGLAAGAAGDPSLG